jgi:hypothetical protein
VIVCDADPGGEDERSVVEVPVDDFDDELHAAATIVTHATAASILTLLWIMVGALPFRCVLDSGAWVAQPDTVMASPR